MRGGVALALVVAACGRLGFDPRDGGIDVHDAAPDGVVPLGPFGAPAVLEEIPVGASWASFTADGLELFYDGNGIMHATRVDTSSPWSTPVRVDEISVGGTDTDPGISGDGHEIWWSSNRSGGAGGYDLWYSSRPDRASAWSVPVPVMELNSSANDFGPAPHSPLLLVFSSFRGGDDDLYIARRATQAAPWEMPEAIVEVNTAAVDTTPFLAADGLSLYFSSDRPGGQGSRDLYVATRSSLAEPFGVPAPFAELSSSAQDDRPWLSPDGRVIVFASDRTGSYRLYEARR